MPIIENRFRRMYWSLFIIYLLLGTSMTMIGATLPKILSDFSWGYGVAGIIIASSSATFAIASIASSSLIQNIGPKATTIIGSVLITIGLACFGASPSITLNFVLNSLIGAGQGFIEPTINWSVLRMEKEVGKGRSMNLMHGSYAIGAIAGPLILSGLLSFGLMWTVLYRGIAILFGILALNCILLPFGLLEKERLPVPSDGSISNSNLLHTPLYWFGVATFLFYVGTELGITTWLAEYSVSILRASPAQGSLMVSFFWFGLLGGRFGAPILFRKSPQEKLIMRSSVLLFLSVCLLNVMGLMSLSSLTSLLSVIFTFLSGVGCSVIYPLAMSILGEAFPTEQSKAVSTGVASGGIGLFAFPFIMSQISRTYGIKAGFMSYAILAAATMIFCLFFAAASIRMHKTVNSRNTKTIHR